MTVATGADAKSKEFHGSERRQMCDASDNNGHTSGSLIGTPFFDPAVALC
jgi:hypothetical protein